MALRHNIKDDPWALAFGRSKLRQLRDTLFDDEPRDEHYATRRYTINGRTIRVRIAGEEEYVFSQRAVAAPVSPGFVLLGTWTHIGDSWTFEKGPLIAESVIGDVYSNSGQWIVRFGNGSVYSGASPPAASTVVRVTNQVTGVDVAADDGHHWWFGEVGLGLNWEVGYEGAYPIGTVVEIYVHTDLYGEYIWY